MLGASEDGAYVYYLTATGLHLEHEGANTADRLQRRRRQLPGDNRNCEGQRRRPPPRLRLLGDRCRPVRQQEHQNRRTGGRGLSLHRARRLRSGEPRLCLLQPDRGNARSAARASPGRVANGAGPWRRTSTSRGCSAPRTPNASSSRHSTRSRPRTRTTTRTSTSGRRRASAAAPGRPAASACSPMEGAVSVTLCRRLRRRLRRLLPDRDLAGRLRSRRQRHLRRPRRRRLPEPETGIPCFGDACQPLPPEPEDPTPGTLRLKKSGNLPPPRAEKTTQVQEGPGQTLRQVHRRKPQRKRRGGTDEDPPRNSDHRRSPPYGWRPPPRPTSGSSPGTKASTSPRQTKAANRK